LAGGGGLEVDVVDEMLGLGEVRGGRRRGREGGRRRREEER
jgi:hypothetical protein